MKNILLTGFLLLVSSASWACSCVEGRASEKDKIAREFGQAALVFVGRVIRAEPVRLTDTVHVRSHFSGQDTAIIYRSTALRHTFAVTQLFKGKEIGAEVIVISDNTSCGISLAVGTKRLMYAFLVNEEANLSGGVREITPYYATDVCSRHQELRFTRASELRQLRQLAKKR